MLVPRWVVPTAVAGLFLIAVTVAEVVWLRRFDLAPLTTAFLAALLWFVAHVTGRLDALREWNWRRLRRKCPSEPWFADHRWEPRGARRSGLRSLAAGRNFTAFVVFGTLGAPVLAMLCLAAATAPAPVGPAFTLLGAVALAGATVAMSTRASRGTVEVGFARFPFRPGDPVELHVGSAPGGPTLEDCVLTLRRIEEQPRSRWTWWSNVVLKYSDQRVPNVSPGPEQFVVVTFDVPEGAGGTCLSSLAPSYWELVIDAQVDDRRFLDRFLIPIYERPPGAVAPAASATAGA